VDVYFIRHNSQVVFFKNNHEENNEADVLQYKFETGAFRMHVGSITA